ncbi:MAG TPA: hypothetical protein VK274_07435 [Pyrinomonadaceae bacterium]|nr:hypothetical protein [Pyrinomonadaceae bacterium]
MKKLFVLTLALGLCCFSEWPVFAQDQPTAQSSAEELEKQKAEREKNAYRLLDQVIDEAQSLRLTENRVRVQIGAADMLWDQNQGRARSLFTMAAEGVAEMGRSQASAIDRRMQAINNGNGFAYQGGGGVGPPPNIRTFQLRQELVMAAARHDAALAYQLLATTKPPASLQPTAEQRGPRANMTSDENLEQQLLGRIAALDPKLAAQNAEQMMEKGQFPVTLSEVISQLRKQDPEAAEKLADKTVKKLQATNILTNPEVSGLVLTLLRLGPRTAGDTATEPASKPPSSRSPVLEQAAYVELLSTVVDAALKATPPSQNRAPANQRTRGVGPVNRQAGSPQPPTDAQIEQNNARRVLAVSQMVMPMVDQYLPAKAQLLRQKLSELGMPVSLAQTFSSNQGESTADALVQAAATAPQQMQSRLYQQAAYKALEEGDTERARQIANDHLQANVRDNVMKRIDFRELAKKAEGARVEDVRQAVARLQTENEKVDLLIQVANDAQKTNQKLALQLLEDARQITNRRPTAYQHFEQQLRVARAFAAIDPARSFEILEPGISQLNELLAAAAVLSGFEIDMFRDGEMTIQGGTGLTNMVNRFGQELAQLAKTDFERSETLSGRFQFAEVRIMTRLQIVQGVLRVRPAGLRGIAPNSSENVIIRQD